MAGCEFCIQTHFLVFFLKSTELLLFRGCQHH